MDLDEQFTLRAGDISMYLATHGYQAYARQNLQVYVETLGSSRENAVIALSSGFMTYPEDAHPAYSRLRREIADSPTTAVLLPSFDCETCVAETVRRQLRRPFSRVAEREEQVIRARFGVYRGLPARKFETMAPVDAVVESVAAFLPFVFVRPARANRRNRCSLSIRTCRGDGHSTNTGGCSR